MENIFLEINEYIKKFPSEYKILKKIYISTGNHNENLLGGRTILNDSRFIFTNKKSYIICTFNYNISNFVTINSIYTIEKFRNKGYAKKLITNYPDNEAGLIFDTFSTELHKVLNSIGAKKINLYNGSEGRKQYIYEKSGKYKNEYINLIKKI